MALEQRYNGRLFILSSPEPGVLVVAMQHGSVAMLDLPHIPLTLEAVRNALITLDAAARAAAGEFD